MEDFDKNEDITEYSELIGCLVVEAKCGKNKNGYDLLILRFDDGKILQVLEEGQVGYFSVMTA